MTDVLLLPKATARSLETMLIEKRVTEVAIGSGQPLVYRELTANQLRKIYRYDLAGARTPSKELENPPFAIPASD